MGVLISGSGGFIGTHLSSALSSLGPAQHREVNIASPDEVMALARIWKPDTVIHLAAKGTVLTPLAGVPGMLDACLDGLFHLLAGFRPRRVVFASSCSVYGDAPARGASPSWEDVHPVSVYGLTKAIGELMIQQWAAETGGAGVILRMGNVIGPAGKGLIAHLVRHALQHPGGSQVMRMRGGGRIVRDYVPVEYAVRILQAAARMEQPSGTVETYNVGSGHALTNGEVALIVTRWLAGRGCHLNVQFSGDVAPGEAWSATLRTSATAHRFGIASPAPHEVEEAIIAAAESVYARVAAEGKTPRLTV